MPQALPPMPPIRSAFVDVVAPLKPPEAALLEMKAAEQPRLPLRDTRSVPATDRYNHAPMQDILAQIIQAAHQQGVSPVKALAMAIMETGAGEDPDASLSNLLELQGLDANNPIPPQYVQRPRSVLPERRNAGQIWANAQSDVRRQTAHARPEVADAAWDKIRQTPWLQGLAREGDRLDWTHVPLEQTNLPASMAFLKQRERAFSQTADPYKRTQYAWNGAGRSPATYPEGSYANRLRSVEEQVVKTTPALMALIQQLTKK